MAAKKQTKKAEKAENKSVYTGKKLFVITNQEEFDKTFKIKETPFLDGADVMTLVEEENLENDDIMIEVEIKSVRKVVLKTEYKSL